MLRTLKPSRAFKQLALLCIGLAWQLPLWAADSRVWSLNECLAEALKQTPGMLRARADALRAESARKESLTGVLPTFSVQGVYGLSDDVSNQLPDANRAVLRTELGDPIFGTAHYERKRLRALAEAAAQGVHVAEEDIRDAVRGAYFQILQQDAALESYGKAEGALDDLLVVALPRYQMGGHPAFDTVKVRSAKLDLQRSKAQAALARADAARDLAAWVGSADGGDLEIQPLGTSPDLPRTLVFQDSSAAMRALNAKLEAAKAALGGAQASRLPSLHVGGDYGYAGQAWDGMSLGWGVDIQADLPLWDWGATGRRVDQAQADLTSAQADLSEQSAAETKRLAHLGEEARALREDEDRLRELLPSLESAAKAAGASYRRGSLGIMEATDSLNLWLQAMLQERADHFGCLSRMSEMQKLSSGSLEVNYAP